MKHQLFEVEKERFFLNDPQKYMICGMLPEGCTVLAYLDSEERPVQTHWLIAETAMERFQESEVTGGRRVEVVVELPENLKSFKKLKVYTVSKTEKYLWFQMKTKELLKKCGGVQYYIEEETVNRRDGILRLNGWAAAPSKVSMKILNEQKQPIACNIQKVKRVDVSEMFQECSTEEKCGFFTEIHEIFGKYMYLVMTAEDGKEAVYRVRIGKMQIFQGKAQTYMRKGMRYFQSYGLLALLKKSAVKVKNWKEKPLEYGDWLKKHLPSSYELEKQRKTHFPYEPKISLVVPLYKTKEEYLKQLIHSIQKQTYANWELCLSDGSGADSPLTELLQKYAEQDERIKVISNACSLQISENTNAAISIATGDYIAFGDHDDTLEEHAFYECVRALNENQEIEVLYTDEDKMAVQGGKYFQPHFKPDFNLDLLHTVNYICHLFVVKRELIEKVGILRPEFDGAQDYDFIFRCVENASQIHHIPKILYHWRSHENSTAENPESKRYAFEAGKRAIEAHFQRIGVKVEISHGEFPGLYRTRYLRDRDPLISILIPNKDHIEDLERCISSVEEKSTYRNFEYIVIENNSTDEQTFAYYKELEKRNPKVRMVYWDGPFNYSDINNFGAEYASGEYLLLLNNDTEVINADWLEEMLGYCMRADVGIVGARLYYEDNTIQHAGVVIGFGGIAGHCFVQQPRSATGYCHRIICAQDYSAVTAACLMVKKSVFDEVGGLSSDLAVAFNDVDFCLKVRNAGYLIVYNPYVELYHYESKSRGLEDTPEKRARFNKEVATIESHWPEVFRTPDPYYNPNLTLKSQDFSLKRI